MKYVPELRQVHTPFGDMSAITIRHLLSHSAGFRMSTWAGWGGDKEWHPFEPPAWKQIDAMLPYTEILFPPGSKFSYSNPGLIYLGRVSETLTNEDYAMYVTKNIFLATRDVARLLQPRALSSAAAPFAQLLPHGRRRERAALRLRHRITVATGGLNAPLTDMAKYVAFLIGDPKKQAGYDVVLKRSSLEEMFTPLHKADDVRSMGLTYFVHKEGGLDLISHSGSQNGFLSYFVVHPASRSGYLVAVNTYTTSESKGGKQSTRAFITAIHEHFVANVFPALAAARPASSSSSRSSR